VSRGALETPPEENQPPQLGKPSNVAAGAPAIISTMKHGISKSGITGAISSLNRVNKFGGFDCPGCAWPDPDGHRTIAEFCENGAKAVADEATKKTITPEFFGQHSVQELSTKSDQWLNSQGRLSSPMILKSGSNNYTPISWNEAFDMIADELCSLKEPDDAIFYTSGRTSNEAAFLWQLLARGFGTNNLPDCSNMCHESSGFALSDSIGIGKGTVKLEDFNKADLILVVGQNPGTNHPRMLTALRDARKNGASIISINPLIETGMKKFKHPQNPLEMLGSGKSIADQHVRVQINGDLALFRGINNLLLKNEMYDSNFIDDFTSNFDAYKESISEVEWSVIEEISGVTKSEIQTLANIIAKSKSMITCWAMGITQHHNSVETIQEIVNTHLIGGHIGREGAGVCPVRGHSNVQGDRTVGINHIITPEFAARINQTTGIDVPLGHGFDAVNAASAMIEKRGKIFFAMGGNFLSAMSDTKSIAKAMNNCKLTVFISTKLNRNHLITGEQSLILPCLGRTEVDNQSSGKQFVSVENSMGIVHSSQGHMRPTSTDLLSEPAIVCGIANALESRRSFSTLNWTELCNNYDQIRSLIESTIDGFEDYNKRIKNKSGFYLPNPPRDDLEFRTNSGKANFIFHPISYLQPDNDEFIMMTIRSHDQYNTTIYSDQDRYRGIKSGRRIVMMNPLDSKERLLRTGDKVDLISNFNGEFRKSEKWYIVEYDIPKGNIATYFPEANELIPLQSTARGSNTPTSKSVIVKVEKHQD
jgi:molybdopterin-dependent oxidoreductase alpha subunit|tara:strand:- start:3703 stop:5988 length:2286 start_codon:yes stop_codon:yes gene_type:complete